MKFKGEDFIALSLSDFYYKKIYEKVTGASRERISRTNLGSIEIPVPRIELQQLLVSEIGQYLKVIDGCSQIIDNY